LNADKIFLVQCRHSYLEPFSREKTVEIEMTLGKIEENYENVAIKGNTGQKKTIKS
jgi:hypothetical protein